MIGAETLSLFVEKFPNKSKANVKHLAQRLHDLKSLDDNTMRIALLRNAIERQSENGRKAAKNRQEGALGANHGGMTTPTAASKVLGQNYTPTGGSFARSASAISIAQEEARIERNRRSGGTLEIEVKCKRLSAPFNISCSKFYACDLADSIRSACASENFVMAGEMENAHAMPAGMSYDSTRGVLCISEFCVSYHHVL